MLFAPYERYQYARAPLVEVICQLRFPTILSIGRQGARRVSGGHPQGLPPVCGPSGAAPPQGGQEGERHRAGASEAHYQLQLHLGGRPLEAQPDPGLHRPVHPELHPVGGLRHPAGPPPGPVYPALPAAFFERIGLRYVNAVSRQRWAWRGNSGTI